MDAAAAPNGAASLVADISTSFDGPVSIRTDEAAVAAAALAAGACTAHDPSGAVNPAYLAVVQAHGASLIIGVPPDTVGVAEFIRTRASSAEAAGIDPAGIVFHAREPSPSAIAGLRWAVCVEEGPPGWGQAVRAVMVGARLVFADATDGNIRSIRRTVSTAAELLARRAAAPGAPVATPATSEPPRQ